MIIPCLLTGLVAGAIAAAVGWAMGADLLTCLVLYSAAGYPVTVGLMLLGAGRAAARSEAEDRELEADLIAFRQNGQPRSEALPPVLARALRLQEQTSLRTRRTRLSRA